MNFNRRVKYFFTMGFLLILFNFLIGCQPKYLDAKLSVDKRVEDLLSKMTLREKVGQMTQIDRSYLRNEDDIANFFLGSVLSGGDSMRPSNAEVWAEMIDNYQRIAQKTRLKIPLLFGVDMVHGAGQVLNTTVFPHHIGMGCIKDPNLVEKAARITAIESRASGVNWIFAPCVAVAQDERWGRTYESFSENPEIVSMMGVAEIKGFQGDDLIKPDSVLACAKHFVADGGTYHGIDQGDAQMDEATLRSIHLKPYIEAVKNNVGSIMISHSSWNVKRVHGNKYLISDVLKKELGFKGLVVSDWGSLTKLANSSYEYIKIGVNAGIDLIMVPDDYINFTNTLISLVNNKEVSIDRINDAVRRILKIKFELGLFEKPFTDRTNMASIGSKEHRDIARDCVRNSLVLLKNNNNILPLNKKYKRIHVAGKNADNLGYQCGGWTLSWQGQSGNITKGTTILKGITELADPSTEITYSIDGSGIKGADLCILVIGETSYAEFKGDSKDLALLKDDITAINNVRKSGVKTVVVLVSGRPLMISDYINYWDGVVAAWLPGTEGGGVSDILFGKFKPTGKLSFTWPKNIGQLPINYGDKIYDPLFPFGYGLTY
jgi:beta-glucosidase